MSPCSGRFTSNKRKIRAKEVRLVGDNVEPGVYPLSKALQIAEEQELDLVVISDKSDPFICRVLDYKNSFTNRKKAKGIKSKTSKSGGKRNQIWPQTDDHDYEFKKNTPKNSWKKVLN